jgi:hypothetical protein
LVDAKMHGNGSYASLSNLDSISKVAIQLEITKFKERQISHGEFVNYQLKNEKLLLEEKRREGHGPI